MINRRKFLQISAVSTLAVLPSWRVCNAYADNIRKPVRGLHFFNPDDTVLRTTAAAFYSDLWALERPTWMYDRLALPSMRKEKNFYSRFIELNKSAELLHYARRGNVFVALAHPGDPASFEPALDHCEIAKRAGAFTFLLAAEAFPHPECDQTDPPRIFDRSLIPRGRQQPDAVFSFMTLDPYMEMLNVASVLGRHYEPFHYVQFGMIWAIFDGKPDVVKLEGGAFGPGQGYRAATQVCKSIDRGTLAGKPVKGAYISFVVSRNDYKFHECRVAADVFRAALTHEGCTLIFGKVPARGDESDYLGISAFVTV